MINKYINKSYINNISDILSLSKDERFIKLINNLDKKKMTKINTHLIHKEKEINQIEQFIFNLDNYISFLKNSIKINQLELRYIISLTIYNKNNKILYNNIYYYENINYYHKEFIKMFMYKYKENMKILNYESLKFEDLVYKINNYKRTYAYFEDINQNNMFYYKCIIDCIN